MIHNPPLILASSSPRRLELLQQISITPAYVIAADIDETPYKGEAPRDLVKRLACSKAQKIYDEHHHAGHVVLAADTVVAVGRRILGKPQDVEEARQFINLLSGRRHNVFTGMAAIDAQGALKWRVAKSVVKVKRLSKVEVETYIAAQQWQGKAGGYGIQGLFSAYVKDIIGSYSNIVGLCLYQTHQLLR